MGLHVFSEGCKIRSLTSNPNGCIMVTETTGLDQAPPLSPKQMRLVENAVSSVLRKGWGQVSVVVVKGKVVAIKTEVHMSID